MQNNHNSLYVNRLAIPSIEAQSFWKPAATKPMTIAIGLLCKDSIVLASDSQTTCDNIKETGIDKIHAFGTSEWMAFAAEAGNADRSWRAFEILRHLSADTKITDYRTIGDLASRAMRTVREELRQQQFNCSPEELSDYIWKHDQQCWLMVAHYFNKKPYLFTVDLATGQANLKNHACDCCGQHYPYQYYATVGTGGALANYLLHEFTNANMPYTTAISAALYVVEEVKKHDTYCSGDTMAGVIAEDGGNWFLPRESMNKVSGKLQKFNHSFQVQWSKKLVESIGKIGKTYLERPEYSKKHLKKRDTKTLDKKE